jgi:hypothetical protein
MMENLKALFEWLARVASTFCRGLFSEKLRLWITASAFGLLAKTRGGVAIFPPSLRGAQRRGNP